jgi:hypothetical protein
LFAIKKGKKRLTPKGKESNNYVRHKEEKKKNNKSKHIYVTVHKEELCYTRKVPKRRRFDHLCINYCLLSE